MLRSRQPEPLLRSEDSFHEQRSRSFTKRRGDETQTSLYENTRSDSSQRGLGRDNVDSDLPDSRRPGILVPRSMSLGTKTMMQSDIQQSDLTPRRHTVDVLPLLSRPPDCSERWYQEGLRTSSFSSTGSSVGGNRPQTPMLVRRLKGEEKFGTKEELYKVDLEDGKSFVCRKRGESFTNPDFMTDGERRIHGFLEGFGRGHEQENQDVRKQIHRVYSFGEARLVIDPKMSKYINDSNKRLSPVRERLRRYTFGRVTSRLPPIYQNKPMELQPRDFSIPKTRSTPSEITDEVWEELKECRYLRPKLKKFQTALETEDESDDVFFP